MLTLVKAGHVRSDVQDLVSQISKEWEACLQSGRPSSRPIVCSPLSTTFNDTVAIDVAYFEQQPFLKIIDLGRCHPKVVLTQKWFTALGRNILSACSKADALFLS